MYPHREYRRLLWAALKELRHTGHKVLCANTGFYDPPPFTRGHRPDAVARPLTGGNDVRVVVVGELEQRRTFDRIDLFAAEGRLILVVPERLYDEAKRMVTLITRHHLNITIWAY